MSIKKGRLMGQKRKTRPSAENLLSSLSRMLVPDYILEYFDIYDAREFPSSWVIEHR